MFVSHQHAIPFLRGAGGFARAGGCGNAAGPGVFLQRGRFMRGVGQQWARRMVAFMRSTNSTAPLQWMAEQMGCDVVQRDSRAAEVAALKQRLQELERAA